LKPYQTKGTAPASVDWRTKGAVSPVRDQGQGETCCTSKTVEMCLIYLVELFVWKLVLTKY
jgi:C1A family cysteine protease